MPRVYPLDMYMFTLLTCADALCGLYRYGSGIALKFMKVVDTNADGEITSEEWHKGWAAGEFDVEIVPGGEGDGSGGGPTKSRVFRLVSRHLTHSSLPTGMEPDPTKPAGVKKKASSKKVVTKIGSKKRIASVPE